MSQLLEFGTDILVTPPGLVDKPGFACFEIELNPGDAFVRMPLKFREDSDFIIRAVKAIPVPNRFLGAPQVALDFTFSFTDSEWRYLSNMQANYQLAAGTGVFPKDLQCPVYVPAGGVILLDLTAGTIGVQATTAQIVFCGVRRFVGVA